MLARLREAVAGQVMHLQFTADDGQPDGMAEPLPLPQMQASHINPLTGEDEFALAEAVLAAEGRGMGPARTEPVRSRKPAAVAATVAIDPNNPETWGRVARNDKCPCGSGKKYKHCHGRQ